MWTRHRAVVRRTYVYVHRFKPGEPGLCPVCQLPGGFHESTVHAGNRRVPRELIKETGWHKAKDVQ